MIRAGATLVAAIVVLAAATAAHGGPFPKAGEHGERATNYRDGAPPGHTGGFGEGHCGACHFDGRPDDGAGRVSLGVPASYEPGARYRIEVSLHHPDLEAAGFQLSARFASGESAGRQAGELATTDHRARIVAGPGGVAFAGHTAAGTAPAEPRVGRWTLYWTAPGQGGDVVFHLAANAANDDDSAFGDHVYLADAISRNAACGASPPRGRAPPSPLE